MEETENNNNTDNIVSTEREQIPTLPKETEESMPLKQNLKMHLVNDSKFDFYKDYRAKEDCTSFFFGAEPISQQCYVCSLCNPLRTQKMCKHCYEVCHEKCRFELMDKNPELEESNKLPNQTFTCCCGIMNKHVLTKLQTKDLIPCDMIKLDVILQVDSFFCTDHNIMICCICSVVCHKNCKVIVKETIGEDEDIVCHCKSEFHTKYNEIALSFPLEQYKKITGVRIWPIQILNILFGTKNTFSEMSQLFIKKLDEFTEKEETEKERKEREKKHLELEKKKVEFSNEFYSLLELFSNTFNRKFKTYYYHEEMTKMFKYQQLFYLLRCLDITSSETTLTKFRLLFIMLFIHLRRDYQMLKSFTSNDFLTSSILDRLKFKLFFNSNSIYTDHLEKKYKLHDGHPLKQFALTEICVLMTKGMNYIKVEENQDEFEIGLKFLCFMMKRLLFDKNDLVLLIKSLDVFHKAFYEYILSEKNNIYSLLEIFNCVVELCYMICVNYNDLVVEKYLNEKGEKSFNRNKIGKFIHEDSEEGEILFRMIVKNCSIITKHYNLLRKEEKDIRDPLEAKREEAILEHKLEMQKKILKSTTGIKMKLPDNGGLFSKKIIMLFNESLSMFCLADNSYQKQLKSISKEELKEYYEFKTMLDDSRFYELIWMTPKKPDSNVLYHLKIAIETMFLDLFTSTYDDQVRFTEKVKYRILNGIDEINQNLDRLSPPKRNQKKDKSYKNDEKEIRIFSKEEKIKLFNDKLIAHLSNSLPFITHNIFDKNKTNMIKLINSFICSHIDETFMKILVFLAHRNFPNLLTLELLRLKIDFLSVFLLSRGGVRYFLTGKNISRIRSLMKYLCFARDDKNLSNSLGKTKDFLIDSMGIVIEFFLKLLTCAQNYNIHLKHHKVLPKIQKVILTHLNYFSLQADNEDTLMKYKKQLLNCMKLLHILSDDFEYEQFEDIKLDIIKLFNDSPQNFLTSDNFTKWFNKKEIEENLDSNDVEKADLYKKNRKIDLDIYFAFFELVSKNTFFIFKNDKYKHHLFKLIYKFNDLEFYKTIFEKSVYITLRQKTLLLHFIRTFYFIDVLTQIDYINHKHQLTNKEYVNLIYGGYVRNAEFTRNISKERTVNIETTKAKELVLKYEQIQELCLVFNLYINELINFSNFLAEEKLEIVEQYFEEIIIGVKSIGDFIYREKKIANKLLPDFYKIVYHFIDKKELILYILKSIKTKGKIDIENYDGGLIDEKLLDMKLRSFNIFNRKLLYTYLQESLFDFLKRSELYRKYSLNHFLEVYDKSNEANFTPFALIETKDFEYFYEKESLEQEKEQLKEALSFKLLRLNETYVNQFISITDTNFLSVLTTINNDSGNIDYRNLIVEYFQSFLNSNEYTNIQKYNTLLSLVTKLLFYDSEMMQEQFQQMITDPYFFQNFNQLLNVNVVLSISSAKNFELINLAQNFGNLTKLTIQFLQLLGEGFNTDYHYNILMTNQMIDKAKKKLELLKQQKDEDNSNTSEDSDIIDVNDQLVEMAQQQALKNIKINEKEIPSIEVKENIYECILNNLKKVYHLMDLKQQIDCEMPYDKLCVITSNFIDFIIEYINSKNNELNDIIKENICNLLFGKKIPKAQRENDEYGNKYYYKGIISIFKVKIKQDDDANTAQYKLRKKMIALMKIKYASMLIAYLQTQGKDEFVDKMVHNRYGPIEIFMEIVYFYNELIASIDEKKRRKLLSVQSDDKYMRILEDLYIFEEDFRESINFNVIIKLFIIIKTIEEIYNVKLLSLHFEKIKDGFKQRAMPQKKQPPKENNQNNKDNTDDKKNHERIDSLATENRQFELDAKYRFNDNDSPYNKIQRTFNHLLSTNENLVSNGNNQPNEEDDLIDSKDINSAKQQIPINETAINTRKAYRLFQFLDTLILKVEIKMSSSEEEKYDTMKLKQAKQLKLYQESILNKYEMMTKQKEEEEEKEDEDDNKEEDAKNLFKERIKKEKEVVIPPSSLTFFLRPYLSYHLSRQSKTDFINKVDRTNATSKYLHLMIYTDFFIFEMISNYHRIGANKLFLLFANIRIYILELINFFFIALQNILLIIHYYRKPSSSDNDYEIPIKDIKDDLFNDNYFICLIHIALLAVVILNWVYFKFTLCFQKNIMLKYNKNFIFRKTNTDGLQNITNPKIINYFKTGNESIISIMNEINKGITVMDFLSIFFLDSFFFNREICFFIYTLFFEVLFFFTCFPLYMVIPVVFIVNLTPMLFDILTAFKMRVFNIITTLLFTNITVYLFTWFTFFYLRNLFDFSDIVEVSSGEVITESFCKSSVQCLLFMISQGIRAGGGIGEVLPTVSFYQDPGFFMLRFFYDIIFHIGVVWILGNVFVGIIVDTFGELRDINWSRENDIKNICFICQISRDDCLKKNIDFDTHVVKEHNVWNYVYFLTYLHLSNANDFNRVENSVWEKLIDQDYGWIPMAEVEDDDDDE